MKALTAKVYMHDCPMCGHAFPSLSEKLEGTGVNGVLCADCWLATQPRVRGEAMTELRVLIRRGCFNLMDFSQEEINCHFRLLPAGRHLNVSLPVDNDDLLNWRDAPMELLREVLQRKGDLFFNINKIDHRGFLAQCEASEAEITRTWRLERKAQIERQLKRLQLELQAIELVLGPSDAQEAIP